MIAARPMRTPVKLVALALFLLPATAVAQQAKQRFSNLDDALSSTATLAGRSGPRGVVWIDGGKRFSFTTTNATTNRSEIRAYDPATGRDSLLFSSGALMLPGTSRPFEYDSFQWARDFRNLVFQTNFQQLYRRSGTSDFYVYSLAGHDLKLAGKGARTAELSPDGAMLGEERGGDICRGPCHQSGTAVDDGRLGACVQRPF